MIYKMKGIGKEEGNFAEPSHLIDVQELTATGNWELMENQELRQPSEPVDPLTLKLAAEKSALRTASETSKLGGEESEGLAADGEEDSGIPISAELKGMTNAALIVYGNTNFSLGLTSTMNKAVLLDAITKAEKEQGVE